MAKRSNNRRINKEYDSFLEEAFNEAVKRISEHNLSIDEISKNTKTDPELVHIVLTNPRVVECISEILLFTKVRIGYRKLNFQPYKVYDNGTIFKVRRNIEPICQVYYSRITQSFYNFKEKVKGSVSNYAKGIYLQEMMDVIEKELNK